MEVTFRTRRLERNYAESSRSIREWGPDVGRRYIRRVNELQALPTFQDMFDVSQLRAHPYKADPGTYIVDLVGRWRLLLRQGERDDQLIIEEVSNHYDD